MTQYYEVEKEDLLKLAEDIYGKNKYNLADDYFDKMPNGKFRFGVDTMGAATFSDNMLLNAVTEGNRTTLSGIYIYNKGADAGNRNDMYKYECILEKNENSILDGYTVVDMKVTDIDELIRNRKGNEHYRVISSSNIIVDDIDNIFTDEQIESIIADMEMLRKIKMNNVTIHVGTEILYYKKVDGELQCSREDDGGTATVYVAFECDKGIIDGYALVEEAAIALFVG